MCNNFIDELGFGMCKTTYTKYSLQGFIPKPRGCYVNQPSSCSDLINVTDSRHLSTTVASELHYSYEACLGKNAFIDIPCLCILSSISFENSKYY